MKKSLALLSLLGLLMVGLGAAPSAEPPVIVPHPITVDPHRSLAVTDLEILKPFTLERVLDQLIQQSGVTGLTAWGLYRQWWDIENEAPGFFPGTHCDDQTDADGNPGLNGFPWECPRLEGSQANPFPSSRSMPYKPVGLINRLDLAPKDGANCGEYRIIFARTTPAAGRNLIIFEAVLPNPTPAIGLEGCRPVAQFWAGLSAPTHTTATLSAALEGFYFNGLPGFEPVVEVSHYGMQLGSGGYGCSTGQIRTDQFMQNEWTLREFALTQDCRCGSCRLVMVPSTVADNPFGMLFSKSSDPRASTLKASLVAGVASLAKPDPNRFSWSPAVEANAAESPNTITDAPPGAPFKVSDYVAQFQKLTIDNPFRVALQNQLSSIGSTLTPDNIIARALSLSCAGCHGLANQHALGGGLSIPFPRFTHVDENIVVNGRYQMSDALEQVFLPHRKQIIETFLNKPPFNTGPVLNSCSRPLPADLQMICPMSPQSAAADARVYPADAAAKLKPVTAESLGGRRTH